MIAPKKNSFQIDNHYANLQYIVGNHNGRVNLIIKPISLEGHTLLQDFSVACKATKGYRCEYKTQNPAGLWPACQAVYRSGSQPVRSLHRTPAA